MAHVDAYVDAPYQGVSQAPVQVRLPTQAEVIEDWLVTVPAGAQVRPAFQFQAALQGITTDNFAYEFINKSGLGKFILTLSLEAGAVVPRLYSLSSVLPGANVADSPLAPLSVTISSAAQAYLNSGAVSPDNDLRLLTVEDYTFILNRNKVTANGSATSAARPYEAMLWLKSGAYGRSYTVTVTPDTGTPVTASILTPNGATAPDSPWVDTSIMAGALYSGSYTTLDGASVGGSALSSLASQGFTVTHFLDTIYISHPTKNFSVDVSDGQAGLAMVVAKDTVGTVSNLPGRCPVNGFTIKVNQNTATPDDDFYMKFVSGPDKGLGAGTWTECIAPGTNLGLDPNTLPVALVYEELTSTWVLDVAAWEGRFVGDVTLAPDPGFIGQALRDITFWKGRIGLLYPEGIRLSSSQSPFRFYPQTLTSVLDSDALEIINPLELQANFQYAVAFKTRLLLWGSVAQAQVTVSQGALTPLTAQIDPFAYYEFEPLVRPQKCNDRVYFTAPRGTTASAVFEMEIIVYFTPELASGDDLSVSIPTYLPASINRVATCPVNYTTVYTTSGSSKLQVHSYRYANKQRVQNAFVNWNLPQDTVACGVFFDNTRLYTFGRRDGVCYLFLTDIADGLVDPNSTFHTRMNFRVPSADTTRVYNSSTGITTVTLPYNPHSEPLVQVTGAGGVGGPVIGGSPLPAYEGTRATVLSWTPTDGIITLEGDWTQVDLLIGESITSNKVVLSQIFYRDQQGKPSRSGRLVVKKLRLELSETAYLQCQVQLGGREPYTYTFEASLWDLPGSDYNKVNLYTGAWVVPVGGDSSEVTITLLTDQALPAKVLGYTWEGEVNPKAQRMQSPS